MKEQPLKNNVPLVIYDHTHHSTGRDEGRVALEVSCEFLKLLILPFYPFFLRPVLRSRYFHITPLQPVKNAWTGERPAYSESPDLGQINTPHKLLLALGAEARRVEDSVPAVDINHIVVR